MNRLNKYLPLFISLILFFFLWKVLYPLLGYNLDSDCVSYLTIAERVAKGEYMQSVNGLWSPLNSWILAFFIKQGHDAWATAKLLNMFFGVIVLIQSFFLFLYFNLNKKLIYYLQIALTVAMVYFVYFQMFADILQLVFVLAYVFILWRKDNKKITCARAIFSGVVMGIAYYAKAYSFFFFAIHFLTTLFWYIYKNKMHVKYAAKVYVCGISSAIITMLPWTFALHKKYNEWSLNGHAGKLNMSWYINSSKSFKPEINLLIPPTYNDSPSFWEDPYQSQQDLSSPFSSAKHFVKWIFRIIHTTVVTLFCFQEISFLSLAILLIAIFYFFYIKRKETSDEIFSAQLLVITVCILPLGYLMMHIETRYIWLNAILLMVLGALLIQRVLQYFQTKILKHLLYTIFALSFIAFPLFQFENLKYKNKDLFETADFLNKNSIKGKFTSNVSDAGRMWVIAYLTKSNFFTIEKTEYSYQQLMDEMKRYDVKYYFYESENNIIEGNIHGLDKVVIYRNLQVYERVN